MSKHVLLTGGTGLIGSRLTKLLLSKGYEVSHLSRKPGRNPNVNTYLWDIEKHEIYPRCLDGVDTIVHLAGAGVAEGRWTKKRKKEIVDSRTQSIALIYDLLKIKNHRVNTIISASGVNYYKDKGDELLTEDSEPAHNFLGKCCVDWEEAADDKIGLGLRVAKFRTGVVLDDWGGALPALARPVKLGFGSPIGNGKQWVSWIHYKDVINMYLYAIENPRIKGVYNMVAPKPVTNKQLTRAVAKQLHRPLWAPNVPAFAIKLLFGEMGTVVLNGTRVSAQKIEESGFKFEYPELGEALKDIYG